MTLGTLPQDVIRKKRDGLALSADEIRFFVDGATRGSVSEGQIGAFTMAVFLRGMTFDEAADLALAMRDSGQVLDWSHSRIDGPRLIDKHSSGGVGDEKITLVVAPLAAACGAYVPNLSARDSTIVRAKSICSTRSRATRPRPRWICSHASLKTSAAR